MEKFTLSDYNVNGRQSSYMLAKTFLYLYLYFIFVYIAQALVSINPSTLTKSRGYSISASNFNPSTRRCLLLEAFELWHLYSCH